LFPKIAEQKKRILRRGQGDTEGKEKREKAEPSFRSD
jgi:hypothetical protein